MKQTEASLDQYRDEWSQRQLKYSQRPIVDLRFGERKSNEELILNVNTRLNDLAELLEFLFNMYVRNRDFYGDAFLAFVGNSVVRGFPWKDFPFTSVRASEIIGTSKTGYTEEEIKVDKKKIHYEHWTPISFFRDLFDNFDDLDRADFYYVLKKHYK